MEKITPQNQAMFLNEPHYLSLTDNSHFLINSTT